MRACIQSWTLTLLSLYYIFAKPQCWYLHVQYVWFQFLIWLIPTVNQLFNYQPETSGAYHCFLFWNYFLCFFSLLCSRLILFMLFSFICHTFDIFHTLKSIPSVLLFSFILINLCVFFTYRHIYHFWLKAAFTCAIGWIIHEKGHFVLLLLIKMFPNVLAPVFFA